MKKDRNKGEISQNLCALRKAMGLIQSEFAELVGVSPRSICTWESGEVATPIRQLKRLLVICNKTAPKAVKLHFNDIDIGLPAAKKEGDNNAEEEQVLKDLIKAQQKIIELQDENKDLRELLSKVPPRSRKKSGNGA
jgi:transcriptional regulator with XRE-family HTH domain